MEVREEPEEAAGVPDLPVAPDASVTPVPARLRGRIALFVGAAAVLGLVAGTCAGFLVQAGREPTELPSLAQPALAQAGGKGPEPLSAAQDRKVRTDGDLRKLLLKKPANAKDADWLDGSDGWMDLVEYAGGYTNSDRMFGSLLNNEFRRAAETGWQVGSTYTVEIHLVQYRQEESTSAVAASEDDRYWAEDKGDADGWDIPGTGDGKAYAHTKPRTKAGYLPLYSAEAHAWRGDIDMEIWVYGSKPVTKKMIMDLAERQMERL